MAKSPRSRPRIHRFARLHLAGVLCFCARGLPTIFNLARTVHRGFVANSLHLRPDLQLDFFVRLLQHYFRRLALVGRTGDG